MDAHAFEQLRARAQGHMDDGDWDLARGDWLAALALAPDSCEALL